MPLCFPPPPPATDLWVDVLKFFIPTDPMQDVHWSMGAFGYFPTYTLGAMAAAQIFGAARAALPTLDVDLAGGNFEPLRQWLGSEVHAVGSLHATDDALLTAVTGRLIDPGRAPDGPELDSISDRPRIDANRSRIDTDSIPNRFRGDPKSTSTRPRLDPRTTPE